jgi:peptidylprolyl isomerase
VTQWGDVTEAKPLPEGVVAPNESYVPVAVHRMLTSAQSPVLEDDPYAAMTKFFWGWPIGIGPNVFAAWPIHCYGYVGVGRNLAPDTGTGAELYTIIGQPQRHMDRNLAVVGRVIAGMEHLSSLPRGSGELGFYTEEEAHLRTLILSVRLGSELPDAPAFEFLDTSSESFAQLVQVRANRNDEFYTVPAGGVDVCSVGVPIRLVTP